MSGSVDAVVIGGGLAGLSAALVLGRCARSAMVVDSGRPRNGVAAHAHGYPTRDGATPAELLDAARAEVRGYGIGLVADTVTAVAGAPDGFAVRTLAGRDLAARRLLVATGLVDELPEVPGLAARWGRDALHCPFCHGFELRGRRTVALLREPRETNKAVILTNFTGDLTILVPPGVELPAQRAALLAGAGVRRVDGDLAEVLVDGDRLAGVRTGGGEVLPADVLYVTPRMVGRDDILRRLGAETEPGLFGPVVRVDEGGATSVPGVWAAGNAVDPGAQLVHAAGLGYRAGQSIVASLTVEDLQRRAVSRTRSGSTAAGSP